MFAAVFWFRGPPVPCFVSRSSGLTKSTLLEARAACDERSLSLLGARISLIATKTTIISTSIHNKPTVSRRY